MMYENTEFGIAPIYRNSVWDMEDLLSTYNKEIVPVILKQCWAIDEMVAGIPQEKIVDEIWLGYERWADEVIEAEKNERAADEADFY